MCFAMLILAMTVQAQKEVYTLSDWNLKDWDAQKGELSLDVSEYKLNFNHPLPYADMQAEWRVRADLKCGTLGTEQVFVCKEGKADSTHAFCSFYSITVILISMSSIGRSPRAVAVC